MKKHGYFITIIMVFTFSIIHTFAATSGISAPKQVEVGHSVKATVTINAAAWDIKVNGTGNTNGCSTHDANASENGSNVKKSITVSCTANSTGIIKVTYSGDITDANGSTKDVSGSTTITVVAQREKSKNNNLKSLSVDGYELSPAFNQDILEYQTTVPSTVNIIKINATKADNYASLSGTGEFEVIEGPNAFSILVTSETGIEKEYKITVIVEDLNPIEVKIDGKMYTLVKNAKNIVAPDNYIETTVIINDIEIPAFYNENTKYTLVGLKDSDGNISLFIYDAGKYYNYNEIKVESISIVALDIPKILKGYKEKEITIGHGKIKALVVKDNSKFAIIYGVNVATGEKDYYKYDLEDNTISKYDDELIVNLQAKNQKISFIMLLTVISTAVLFILTLVLAIANSKKKKLIKKYIDKKEEISKRNSGKERNIKKNSQSDPQENEKHQKDDEKNLEYDLFDEKKKNKSKR